MTKIRDSISEINDLTARGNNFEDALKSARVLAKTDRSNDYRQASTNDKPPSFEQYKDLEQPGSTAADTVRYTTTDGEKVTVYRSSTPKLYQRVVRDYYTREAVKTGFTRSVDNDDKLAYYEHITDIDSSHASEGVITYTFGANKYVINKDDTPDTFTRLLQMEKALGYKDNGYALLGSEEKLSMSSQNYKDIVFTDDGVALVTAKDDKRLVISSQINEDAYKQLLTIADVREQLKAGEANGYSLLDALPDDVNIDKLKVESIDDKTGLIRFEYDGKHYMLPPGDAAAAKTELFDRVITGLSDSTKQSSVGNLHGSRLYNTLAALKKTEGTPGHAALIEAIKNKHVLATDAQKTADIKDIDKIRSDDGGVLVVSLKNGGTVTVIKDIAPKAFEAFSASAKMLEGIERAKADGFRLAAEGEYLPSTEDIGAIGAVGNYGPGLIDFTYRKPGGEQEKIVVSEALNPEMFAQVSGHRDEINLRVSDPDALRKKHGLPAHAEIDFKRLETTESKDGTALTVQELATSRLVDSYREGVENGNIAIDDPRAKFLRAIEAKSMTENGIEIIPEHAKTGIRAAASDPLTVTGRDVREEIFDVKAIDEALGKLSNDDTVKADLERFYEEAEEKVIGGSDKIAEAKEKLKKSAESSEFLEYIKDLQEHGQGELAQLEIQSTSFGLAQIDPELAQKFIGDISRDFMIMDLDALMADPSKISQENSDLAAIDTTHYWLRAARAIPDIPAQLISSWEGTIQKVSKNKPDAAALSNIYAELGETYKAKGVITSDDLQKAFSAEKNAFRSLSSTEKDNLTKMFANMKDTGTLGSVSGVFGLARGIYQLHGNPGALASTSEGRLAIAADFITFASFSNNFLTLGAKTYDSIFKTKVYDHLGLTKSIPDMWRKPPQGLTYGGPETDLSKHLVAQGFIPDPSVTGPDGQSAIRPQPEGIDKPSSYPNYDPESFRQGYLGGKGTPNYRVVDAKTGHRIAGSLSRFIGSSADLAGAGAGLVLSALGLRDGIKNHDPIQIASSAVGLGGGLAGLVAGISSVSSAWGIASGALGRVISAAGPVGFLLSAGLGFVGAIINTIKSQKLHKISLKNWEQIKQFEQDGLLKKGGEGQKTGSENYVWLQSYLSQWRQRDAPDDQSIFEFRSEEWQDDKTKHLDFLGDGPNETSKLYKGYLGKTTFIDEHKAEWEYSTGGYGSYDSKGDYVSQDPGAPKTTI